MGTAKLIAPGTAKLVGSNAPQGQSPEPSGQEEPEMSAKRIETHVLQDLVRLHRMGSGAREVARLLGVSPNTEREYRRALGSAGILGGDPNELPSLEALRSAVHAFAPPKVAPQQTSSVEP